MVRVWNDQITQLARRAARLALFERDHVEATGIDIRLEPGSETPTVKRGHFPPRLELAVVRLMREKQWDRMVIATKFKGSDQTWETGVCGFRGRKPVHRRLYEGRVLKKRL